MMSFNNINDFFGWAKEILLSAHSDAYREFLSGWECREAEIKAEQRDMLPQFDKSVMFLTGWNAYEEAFQHVSFRRPELAFLEMACEDDFTRKLSLEADSN